MLFLGSGAALEPSSIVRLGNRIGGTYIGPEPLADGVWNPTPDTWAFNTEDFIHPDERILVLEAAQQPYANMPAESGGLQPLPASPNNYLAGFTAIFEFRTPGEKIPPATPYRVVDFASGAHMDIRGDAAHGEGIIGLLELTNADGSVTHLSLVGESQRMRYVSAVRQIGNVLHNFFATDGANLQHEWITLPDGFLPGVGASTYNAELTDVVGGFVLAWPFGDTVPAVTDPEVDWVRFASSRSPGNGIMEIPLWPEPAAAVASSGPMVASFLEALPELYNWGQHQTHVDGQRDGAFIGNPQFIFDGDTSTVGQAHSAAWQNCNVYFPDVPVSNIRVDKLTKPCRLRILEVNHDIVEGQEIDFDPPIIVPLIYVADGPGIWNEIGISVLGPHPIYVDGEPLMVDGVPLYTD